MNTKEVIELSDRYIMNTYRRLPVVMVRGQGVRLWDADGREYLDFVSGLAVNSLGHSHPKVVKAIWRQANTLMHVSNLYHIEQQARLAQLLCENSFAAKAFFCNSGTEAVEAAIKLARKYTKTSSKNGAGKYEIITAKHSFHGRTLAAITATGQPKYQKYFEPLPPGFKYVPFNHLQAMQEAITAQTCAIMLEPIQGEGGVYPATKEYLQGVARLCRENNLLLILDEIQCGLGRSGKFLAHQLYEIEPDICTLAKALGNGFPIGAMLAKEQVAQGFEPGDHASTFGGNPLACEVALTVLQVLLDEGIIENAAKTGQYFKNKLLELATKHPQIKAVRGAGLMLGVELTGDGQSVVDYCRQQGLLINCINNKILRFLPPLIVKKSEIDTALEILDRAIMN